jgi:hypothetical protein
MTDDKATDVAAVKYAWREWYTRVTYESGRVQHYGPWNSQWAANRLAERLQERFALKLRNVAAGDGDTCPLWPEHGNMLVLRSSSPPVQWCPHAEHEGTLGKNGKPRSRSRWPLYGFEESVAAYLARIDSAIRQEVLSGNEPTGS